MIHTNNPESGTMENWYLKCVNYKDMHLWWNVSHQAPAEAPVISGFVSYVGQFNTGEEIEWWWGQRHACLTEPCLLNVGGGYTLCVTGPPDRGSQETSLRFLFPVWCHWKCSLQRCLVWNVLCMGRKKLFVVQHVSVCENNLNFHHIRITSVYRW